jgi:hypothetical protein
MATRKVKITKSTFKFVSTAGKGSGKRTATAKKSTPKRRK